jgi:hypothetical protein
MHHTGVWIIAGTGVPSPYRFPGFTLHDELALLVEAGLSPMEALRKPRDSWVNLTGAERLSLARSPT